MVLAECADRVRIDGFAHLPRPSMKRQLDVDAWEWRTFASSWDNLGPDAHMADGGRYRRRRFGVLSLKAGVLVSQPHQPHFQARAYNPLNGGVDRWFAPVTQAVIKSAVVARLVALSRQIFFLDGYSPRPDRAWRVELHQFRIEAREGAEGLPTPEGVHRDGVDWVAVMLVSRMNVERGVTAIFDERLETLGAFTLAQPMDAVFLDDHRVLHGVTPIAAIDPELPAYRDVLVMTFTKMAGR